MFACGSGTSGVVGTAKVDDVGVGEVFEVREKVVGVGAGHVNDVVVLFGIGVDVAGLAHHDGGVYVDGVGWILCVEKK